MAEIAVQSNVQQWGENFSRYVAHFRLNRRVALRNEVAKVGRRMIQFTPPQTRAQGRAAVERDISRIFFTFAKTPSPKPIPGMGGAVSLFQDQSGQLWGAWMDRVNLTGNMALMGAWHRKNRDNRGRVRRGFRPITQIGAWKIIEGMVVPQAAYNAFLRQHQDMVGEAKGGWADGTVHFGGAVAQWILNHRGAGTFEDQIDANESVTFRNRSHWASGVDSDRIVRNALGARANDLAKAVQVAHQKAKESAFRSGASIFK